MQDRQHINNDPLVDRGWTQMQAQLEEVMPVQKRRIFPWWILFLSIGVVSSLGAYGWMSFYGNTTIDTQNEQKIKTTPLQVQVEVPIAQIESKETFINTKNNTSTQNASSTVKTLPSFNNTSSVRQEKVIGNENKIQSNQSFATSTPLAKEENKRSLKETIFSNTKPVIVAENALNEESVAPSLPKRTIDIIAALETAEIGLLKENTSLIEKKIDFSEPKKSHLIIEGRTETGFGGNPQGGSLGLAYQHRINNKMAYEIDLSYQAVSINLFSDALNSKSRDEDSRFNSQVLTGLFPTLSVAQAYNQLRINKMNLGVSTSKKVGARWSLGIGTQVSYFAKATIAINTTSPVGNIYEETLDSNFDPFNETIQVYAFDSASNLVLGDTYQLELKRWQLSALFRVHYRISNHWEIEANYRKALTKWPDNKNTYGSSSFVGLGLRYYIW